MALVAGMTIGRADTLTDGILLEAGIAAAGASVGCFTSATETIGTAPTDGADSEVPGAWECMDVDMMHSPWGSARGDDTVAVDVDGEEGAEEFVLLGVVVVSTAELVAIPGVDVVIVEAGFLPLMTDRLRLTIDQMD